MIDCGGSDKILKICGKMDNSNTYKSLVAVIFLFNWNHFEMRLLNLRINFFIYCGLFFLILVVFCFFLLFLLSLRFGQISPRAFFR